ncbi:MAG: hypothetical protein JXA21_13145 [Anaerolineae bacterium]|nr:hypothetical protein [Anaerolineae bacterium]
MSIDRQILISKLTQEFGYPPKNAPLVAQKLAQFSPQIASAFEQWWKSGVLPELSVEGYSLAHLVNERSYNPIAAFLTLDWLVKEPDKAKVVLQKGHDRVSRGR